MCFSHVFPTICRVDEISRLVYAVLISTVLIQMSTTARSHKLSMWQQITTNVAFSWNSELLEPMTLVLQYNWSQQIASRKHTLHWFLFPPFYFYSANAVFKVGNNAFDWPSETNQAVWRISGVTLFPIWQLQFNTVKFFPFWDFFPSESPLKYSGYISHIPHSKWDLYRKIVMGRCLGGLFSTHSNWSTPRACLLRGRMSLSAKKWLSVFSRLVLKVCRPLPCNSPITQACLQIIQPPFKDTRDTSTNQSQSVLFSRRLSSGGGPIQDPISTPSTSLSCCQQA